MHGKRDDYQRTGVIDYLVVLMEEQEIHWLDLAKGDLIRPNRQGISRSQVFPGLWIDAVALLGRDSARLMEVLEQGLSSRAHSTFVKRLQTTHRRRR